MDAGAELATPPLFMAFDCLRVHGRDLRPLPLRDRRKALEDVVAGAGLVYPARPARGRGARRLCDPAGARLRGPRREGRRAPYHPASVSVWRKVKVRHEARFVVVGFAIADSWPYGLLLAEREGERLVYRGGVEFGVGRRVIEAIAGEAQHRIRPTCIDAKGWRRRRVGRATRRSRGQLLSWRAAAGSGAGDDIGSPTVVDLSTTSPPLPHRLSTYSALPSDCPAQNALLRAETEKSAIECYRR